MFISVFCSIFHILIFAYLVYHIHSTYADMLHTSQPSVWPASFWQLISHWHKCHTDINSCPWVSFIQMEATELMPLLMSICVQMKMYRKVMRPSQPLTHRRDPAGQFFLLSLNELTDTDYVKFQRRVWWSWEVSCIVALFLDQQEFWLWVTSWFTFNFSCRCFGSL